MAGIEKGRGGKFGCETVCKGEGRRGIACKEAIIFAIPATGQLCMQK